MPFGTSPRNLAAEFANSPTPTRGVAPGMIPLVRQYGYITQVNASTVQVQLAGDTTPIDNVQYGTAYGTYGGPRVGDVVEIDTAGSDIVVRGTLGPPPVVPPPTPSPWTTYTPTWAVTSGTPSTSTAIAGAYEVVGKTMRLAIYFVAGSTFNGGTGPWTFTLPATYTTVSTMEQSLFLKAHTSVGDFTGFAYISASDNILHPYVSQDTTHSNMQALRNYDAGYPNGIPVSPGSFPFVAGQNHNLFIGGMLQIA